MLCMIKWFTGLIFAIIHLEGNEASECSHCNGDKITFAICECENTVKLPEALNENLQNLTMNIYVTDKKVLKFEKDHLMKFVNLKTLAIQARGVTELEMSFDLLKPLKNLETLNLTALEVPVPEIPISIKNLIANIMGNNSHPDMSLLEHLETLDYERNFADDFPKISKKAPLFKVDMSGNPLRNMTYYDLSHFCLMTTLCLKGSLIERNPIQCCGIRTWTRDVNISTNIHCGNYDEKCDATIGEHDQEAEDIYFACLNRTGQLEAVSFIKNFLHFIVAAALIVALGFLVYKYYGSNAVKIHRENQRATTSTSKPQFFDDEEDDGEEEEDSFPIKH